MKTQFESKKESKKKTLVLGMGLAVAAVFLLAAVVSSYSADRNGGEKNRNAPENLFLIDEWRKELYVSPIPKEPLPGDAYERRFNFASLLSSDIRRRDAQIELGLTDRQVDFLKSVVWEDTDVQRYGQHSGRPTGGPRPSTLAGAVGEWQKDIDRRIKYSMSPLQYVRFRDWMAEQWNTDTEHWHIVRGEPVSPVPPENRHLLKFLRERIGLNDLELQRVKNFLNREKSEKILPVRIEFYDFTSGL